MPSYSRTKGAIVASQGYYVGAKGTETVVISSTGIPTNNTIPMVVATGSGSAAQTIFFVAPAAGYVGTAYVISDTADRSAAITVSAGSSTAATTLASVTTPTGSSAVTVVTSLTAVTSATVTAGQLCSVTRAVQGTTGTNTLTINFVRTA